MIIDMHGHLNAPPELYAYKAGLLSSRGAYDRGFRGVPDERMKAVVDDHVKNVLDAVGTDMQFLSPRPFQLMHSEPRSIVDPFCRANNDLIAKTVQMYPTRYQSVAGLPQVHGEPIDVVFEEMDRCINDLGFIGIMINPDPSEGMDNDTPPLGHQYWYPLYERMVKYDVPAIIHSASCKNIRESYTGHFITEESIGTISLCDSTVFEDFPTLKIIMCHGGGSVPYQIGRWRALRWRNGGNVTSFDDSLKQLYFDSVLYNKESLEFLFKMVGTDRCMFGTERPGTGSSKDPNTGRWLDDLKPVIDSIEWLTDQDRKNIYEDTTRRAYPRFKS